MKHALKFPNQDQNLLLSGKSFQRTRIGWYYILYLFKGYVN